MRQFLYLSAWMMTFSMGMNLQLEAANQSPQIVTSRKQFSIPFRFDQQQLIRLNAQKVHLFVSRNGGQTWKQVQTTSLNQSQFVFQPQSDGEYWFTVAISDAEQVMYPEPGLNPPGLKIVVDRTRPELNLQTNLIPGRQLELNWQASDAHPDVQSLELEFRNSPDDLWNRVYVKKQLSGKTAWRIKAGQYPEVRGRISDTAGNITERIVKLRTSDAPIKTKETSIITGLYDSRSSSKPPLPSGMNHTPQFSSQENRSNGQLQMNRPRQIHEVEQADYGQNRRLLRPIQQPAPSGIYQSSYTSLNSVRFMNAHQFEIDYQLADVGPSGVGVVELFITQDNGAQWWRYGVDSDRKSPMVVKTPEDGRYGFHFRIHSGVGNASPPPQPGQKPQIALIVDSKNPDLKFLRSQQGHGNQINQVTVQWDYYDEQPAEKPISLFYSSSQQGPWELIDRGLKNTGTYSFSLPRNTPAKLYLKLSARDAAGNLAEAISQESLMIDLARPTARIITIDPVR